MADFDPTAWGSLLTASLIGIAAIVGAFARPLFQSIFAGKSRGCPITETAVTQLDQLHDWHGPDDRGEQGWRGHGIERRLESMEQTQAKGFDHLREGQGEVAKLLRELITVTRKD